jgi:glutamate synthase domain-containing protein 2
MEPWLVDIKKEAQTGKPLVSGGRSNKHLKVSFDDLIFIQATIDKKPIDYFRKDIGSETIIGKSSKHPLKLAIPIMIAGMSYGALSKEAKLALAKASTKVSTVANTGEGGMLPEERKYAKLLIAQYSTARFGVNKEYITSADAIEIKFGQGAKPGQGGLLPGDKVTKEIAKVRGVKHGEDVHSPPFHHDINNIEDLRETVSELRRITKGKPIIIKLAAGDVETDVKLALKANPDVIAIDGHAGATGAAPKIMLDEFGIPTLSAVVKARKVMDKLKAKQELIVGGGINSGADAAKALALGADAVFMGFSLFSAVGCTYCKQCYLGKCPFGVTTQDPELRKRLKVDEGAQKIANFMKAITEEIKMVAGACGYNDIHKLNRNNLRSLSLLTKEITGIPLV